MHKRFAGHGHEFMLVMDGEQFVGLCARQKIGMVLGARFGFAIHSNEPVREAVLPEATIIRVNQPLEEVLAATCTRPNATLYDDVVLMDEHGAVLGLVYSRTLVRLQNGLLVEKILQLESKQQEINRKNAQMEGDLLLAREIQLAMLPTQMPEITGGQAGARIGLRLKHRYESAEVVSGDFFHVLKITDGSIGVFVCDVMGHGVRSAFVTAMLRALVEESRAMGDNPGELLTHVNSELRAILKPMDTVLYATAFYLVADVARGQIRFAKAGHPNPLLLRRGTGEVRSLKCAAGSAGPALGMMNNSRYANTENLLEADDVILLFTDGIYEVFDADGNEFGVEKLATAVKQRRALPLDALMDGLIAEARNYSAEKKFDDDVCVIALEAVRG